MSNVKIFKKCYSKRLYLIMIFVKLKKYKMMSKKIMI